MQSSPFVCAVLLLALSSGAAADYLGDIDKGFPVDRTALGNGEPEYLRYELDELAVRMKKGKCRCRCVTGKKRKIAKKKCKKNAMCMVEKCRRKGKKGVKCCPDEMMVSPSPPMTDPPMTDTPGPETPGPYSPGPEWIE